MRSKTLGCGKICNDKNSFQNSKSSISINEVEVNRILLFDKTSCGDKDLFERYIGHRHKDGTFSPLSVNFLG